MCVRQWMIYVSTDKTEFAFGWRYFRFTSDSCPRLHNIAEHENYVIDRVSVTCFRVVTSRWLPWVAARAACSSNGDRLAVLKPVEKARFVVVFLKINKGASRPQHLWNTSLPASGPDLVWENGQRVNYTATAPFWYKDRPNNKDNTDNVLGMKADKNFLWEDLKESAERVYICERLLSLG
ncbi:hypothetical protein V1264_015245 [Littorina saxatilis]|uniref:C-type lectin domain-containing protein n=1 Tax=Littorina saxatilis TaxID=31220 RepID=A0AAN9GFR8_9CAEN